MEGKFGDLGGRRLIQKKSEARNELDVPKNDKGLVLFAVRKIYQRLNLLFLDALFASGSLSPRRFL